MTKLYAALAAFVLAAMIGGTALYTQLQSQPDPCGMSAVAGASIGGPFELLNTKDETVTDAQVIDRPALVYFGYTFCPDVCPFDVARNAEAVDLLKQAGHDVRLVFVTIDPARDTPEALADYQDNMYRRHDCANRQRHSDPRRGERPIKSIMPVALAMTNSTLWIIRPSLILCSLETSLQHISSARIRLEVIAEKTACFIEKQ